MYNNPHEIVDQFELNCLTKLLCKKFKFYTLLHMIKLLVIMDGNIGKTKALH